MSTYCVLVTFQPYTKLLARSINSISGQVDKILVIDNSPTSVDFSICEHISNIEVIHLNENIGIAAAQNIGITKALADNATYILLSDQDTIYPSDYINRMIPVFSQHSSAAAIVPRFTDSNKMSADGFVTLHPLLFLESYPEAGRHELFHAIASGKIIKADCLARIGLMSEDLFIDWVDFEWCWRARKLGYKIIGNADVCISHQLGDGAVNLGFREINVRSPLRHYYITRNAFYLALHSNSLDLKHRIVLFFKSFRYIVGFPLIAKPRAKNLYAVLLGFVHGCLGITGKQRL